jgi:hypothetical protein
MSSPTMQDETRLPSNICGGIESTIENILFPQHQLEPIQSKLDQTCNWTCFNIVDIET